MKTKQQVTAQFATELEQLRAAHLARVRTINRRSGRAIAFMLWLALGVEVVALMAGAL